MLIGRRGNRATERTDELGRAAIRVRRRVAFALVAAALLDLGSAVTPPLEVRLRLLLAVVPLAVPEVATALVVLTGLGLLILAGGVRRGQRTAYNLALALLCGSVVLHIVKGVDLEESAFAGIVALYLFRHRGAFRAEVDRDVRRRGLLVLAAGAAGAFALGTAAVEVVHHRGHRPPIGTATAAVAERLIGLRTIVLPDRLSDFLTPALGALGIGLLVYAAVSALRPLTHAAAERRLDVARSIVRDHGQGTLDYFALRDDKDFFFYGDSLVAYGVYGGVCVVAPDPIGPPHERARVWRAFRRYVNERGWTVAVLGAGEEWLPIYRGTGMRDLYVGDEAIVALAGFSLDGGRHKSLRQAVNRVLRYGYTVEFHDPATIPVDLADQLRDLMARGRRGGVERGFSMTLGRVFSPADEGLLLTVCRDSAGLPVAFCQFVPAPGIDGYSLDLMRRDDGEHPNGLLDCCIVATIEHLRAQGHTALGLNFATMRALLAGEGGDRVGVKMQRWLAQRLSGSMQIESLWRFTAKFDPSWLPRYAVYDMIEHVVPAAFAIARAESWWELPLVGRFLVPEAAAVDAPD